MHDDDDWMTILEWLAFVNNCDGDDGDDDVGDDDHDCVMMVMSG